MSTIWDGDSLPDAIGRELERKGFAPFGTGVPHVAADVARLWFGDQIDRLTSLADRLADKVARVEALLEANIIRLNSSGASSYTGIGNEALRAALDGDAE